MAFLHEDSCECCKSELELFSVPSTQTSVETGNWIEYHPLTTMDDGSPIEFDISGNGEDYIDLTNTMLYVQAKIMKRFRGRHRRRTRQPVSSQSVFPGGYIFEWNASDFIYEHVSVQGHVGDTSELRRRCEKVTVDICTVLRRSAGSHG